LVILVAFVAICVTRSLSDSPVDLFAIESLTDAEKAITTIKQQG
jgi:hypothetical protein